MIKVRHSVFETNSSSSHSISISDTNELLDVLIPEEDGRIIISGKGGAGEFGWGLNRYNDAYTKALYCAVDSDRRLDRMEQLKRVIKEQTGCDEVVLDINTDFNSLDTCYIDHESVGTSGQCFDSDSTLKNFIFNKNSWLFIANDNDDIPSWFYTKSENIECHEIKLISEEPSHHTTFDVYGELTENNFKCAEKYIVYDGETKYFEFDEYAYKFDELVNSNLYEFKYIDLKRNELTFQRPQEFFRAINRLNKKMDKNVIEKAKEEKKYVALVMEEIKLMNSEPENTKIIKFIVDEK